MLCYWTVQWPHVLSAFAHYLPISVNCRTKSIIMIITLLTKWTTVVAGYILHNHGMARLAALLNFLHVCHYSLHVCLGGLEIQASRARSMDFSGRKHPEHKSTGRDFKLGVPSLRFQAQAKRKKIVLWATFNRHIHFLVISSRS